MIDATKEGWLESDAKILNAALESDRQSNRLLLEARAALTTERQSHDDTRRLLAVAVAERDRLAGLLGDILTAAQAMFPRDQVDLFRPVAAWAFELQALKQAVDAALAVRGAK
ncbi:MAG TPA: hypothetical protein VIY56_17325 [Vicinamibacterales bacterium]